MNLSSNEIKENSGIEIRLEVKYAENSKVIGCPIHLNSTINVSNEAEGHPYSPLPYFTDALLGLSAYKLNLNTKDYVPSTPEDQLISHLWLKLEPMYEVYQRSYQRVRPLLHSKSTLIRTELEQSLEQSLNEIIKQSCTGDGIHFDVLLNLIDSLNYFESKRSHPVLFDTQLQLSETGMNTLHTLNSLLYNLRAISAIYYNSKRKEPLYESLHLDSVKDYFHAPDLLTNETMLYYQFLKLCKKGQINEHIEASMIKAFRNHLPHSHYLVHSLPDNFFSNQNSELLEQSLYTFQIDWLLGSPAGLLYRIREELIGIKEGYENTFWPELHSEESDEPTNTLHVNCVLDNAQVKQLSNEHIAS